MSCRDSNAGQGCRSFGEAWGGVERRELRGEIRVERLGIWELEVTCNTTFRMVLLSLFQKNLRRRG